MSFDRVLLQLLYISAWFSQGINCVLLGGHPDQTISARAWLNRYIWYWGIVVKVLDGVFWLIFRQRDHCRKSHEADVAFAEYIAGLPR
jgi:hypothetical protein